MLHVYLSDSLNRLHEVSKGGQVLAANEWTQDNSGRT
jgi:hypothetical protein